MGRKGGRFSRGELGLVDPCRLRESNPWGTQVAAPWYTLLAFGKELIVPAFLNQDLGFDEVRWATLRKTSYDSRLSFQGSPQKTLLPTGTNLFRLVNILTGTYFDSVWWIPAPVFRELHDDANRSAHGGGRLFRNYVAQYLALPSGNSQLCVVEIQLTTPVYAWVGHSSPLFDRPGGMEQVYLPNLSDRGSTKTRSHAGLVRTYWLKF
jgi:hypothetical protein